nr:unnamed protein product [Digitaria exilis]
MLGALLGYNTIASLSPLPPLPATSLSPRRRRRLRRSGGAQRHPPSRQVLSAPMKRSEAAVVCAAAPVQLQTTSFHIEDGGVLFLGLPDRQGAKDSSCETPDLLARVVRHKMARGKLLGVVDEAMAPVDEGEVKVPRWQLGPGGRRRGDEGCWAAASSIHGDRGADRGHRCNRD